jgi:hypothetical protein
LFIEQIEARTEADHLFADTVSQCARFGQTTFPEKAARFERLKAHLSERLSISDDS